MWNHIYKCDRSIKICKSFQALIIQQPMYADAQTYFGLHIHDNIFTGRN